MKKNLLFILLCNLLFIGTVQAATTATDYIKKLAETDTTNLAYDETTDNNLRYIGANPNNYIDLGENYATDIYIGYDSYNITYQLFTSLAECQADSYYYYNCAKQYSAGDPILWRIIGVMNNIDNGNGVKETRLKIRRVLSAGYYTWNESEINEWSTSTLEQILNEGAFYQKTNAACYSGSSSTCDYTIDGLGSNEKSFIRSAVWNTGTNELNSTAGNASNWYSYERSDSYGNANTDNATRTTSWTGEIGLFYPSDYGYATSGGTSSNRGTCLISYLQDYSSDCASGNWLYTGKTSWTITPFALSSCGDIYGDLAMSISTSMAERNVRDVNYNVYPTAYVASIATITSGTGTSSDPYVLSISAEDQTIEAIKNDFLTNLKVARGGSRSKTYLSCDSSVADCTKIASFDISNVSFDSTLANGNTSYLITYNWTCSDDSTCFYTDNTTSTGTNAYTATSLYEVGTDDTIVSLLSNTTETTDTTTVENPATGSNVSYIVIMIGIGIATVIYLVSRKKSMYKI